jgi:hypothetical protein
MMARLKAAKAMINRSDNAMNVPKPRRDAVRVAEEITCQKS